MQQRLGLIWEEADVGQAARRGHRFERLALGAVADDRDRQPLPRPQPVGGLDQDIEVLRQADVARVHQHEAIGEAVLAGEGVVLGPGHDRLAVGPVVNHVHARRVRALFLDQPAAHAIAERDNRVGVAQQITVDSIERPIDPAVAEVFEQRRDLGKDVLADEYEPRPGATRRPQRGETDDRRIGQRDDHVGRPTAKLAAVAAPK